MPSHARLRYLLHLYCFRGGRGVVQRRAGDTCLLFHSPKRVHVHVHELHQIPGLCKEHGSTRLRLKKPAQAKTSSRKTNKRRKRPAQREVTGDNSGGWSTAKKTSKRSRRTPAPPSTQAINDRDDDNSSSNNNNCLLYTSPSPRD